MRRCLLLVSALLATSFAQTAPPSPSDWKAKVAETIPLLGHRNWILVVDSAYPLQSSPGVETIETNSTNSTSSGLFSTQSTAPSTSARLSTWMLSCHMSPTPTPPVSRNIEHR